MFDIGFSELCMVALVALLVIGPERLPKVARVSGLWLGRLRRMVASVKAEIGEELRAEEMRQILREQTRMEELSQLKADAERVARKLSETGDTLAKPAVSGRGHDSQVADERNEDEPKKDGR